MAQTTDGASLAYRPRPIRSSSRNVLALFWPTRQAEPKWPTKTEVESEADKLYVALQDIFSDKVSCFKFSILKHKTGPFS